MERTPTSEKDKYTELYLVVPEKKEGLLSDSVALQAISRLHKSKGLSAVIADPDQAFSLVYRYCQKNGINFEAGREIYNLERLEEVLNKYEEGRIVHLSYGRSDSELNDLARRFTKKEIKTEIRKIF